MNPIALLAFPAAFLLGSLPTALLMGRARGIDIRQHGSGNVGATNVFRVLGKGPGIACLVIDALKGWAPAFLLGGAAGARIFPRPETLTQPVWMLAIGLAAVAGHSFSPWVQFKGGKGVATSLGVFLAVAPIPMLICLALGIALIAATGYVSLASVTGAVLLPILVYFLPPGGEPSWTLTAVTAALGAFVIWKHRTNIQRLLAGNENRIFARGAKPKEETR